MPLTAARGVPSEVERGVDAVVEGSPGVLGVPLRRAKGKAEAKEMKRVNPPRRGTEEEAATGVEAGVAEGSVAPCTGPMEVAMGGTDEGRRPWLMRRTTDPRPYGIEGVDPVVGVAMPVAAMKGDPRPGVLAGSIDPADPSAKGEREKNAMMKTPLPNPHLKGVKPERRGVGLEGGAGAGVDLDVVESPKVRAKNPLVLEAMELKRKSLLPMKRR
jgi:hypothetical protein